MSMQFIVASIRTLRTCAVQEISAQVAILLTVATMSSTNIIAIVRRNTIVRCQCPLWAECTFYRVSVEKKLANAFDSVSQASGFDCKAHITNVKFQCGSAAYVWKKWKRRRSYLEVMGDYFYDWLFVLTVLWEMRWIQVGFADLAVATRIRFLPKFRWTIECRSLSFLSVCPLWFQRSEGIAIVIAKWLQESNYFYAWLFVLTISCERRWI